MTRREVTQAEMRQMATRELLRRAALATPMVGGISILGLLALSMAKEPDTPDTVVGSTTMTSSGQVADEPTDEEVAASGDVVTAESSSDASDDGEEEWHDSGSDSSGSDGSDDGGVVSGDERRGTDSGRDGRGRPGHGRPNDRDDEDADDEGRGDDGEVLDPGTIEIAGGLPPYSVEGQDSHGRGRDGDRDSHDGGDRHDGNGGISVNVGIDPVNVSANVRVPSVNRSSPPRQTAGGSGNHRPNDHKPSTPSRPTTPKPPSGTGNGKGNDNQGRGHGHDSDRDHRGNSTGHRAPKVVLPPSIPDPLPSSEAEIKPPGDRNTDPEPPTDRDWRRDGGSLLDRLGRGSYEDIGDEPEAEADDRDRDALIERLRDGGLGNRAGYDVIDDEVEPAEPPHRVPSGRFGTPGETPDGDEVTEEAPPAEAEEDDPIGDYFTERAPAHEAEAPARTPQPAPAPKPAPEPAPAAEPEAPPPAEQETEEVQAPEPVEEEPVEEPVAQIEGYGFEAAEAEAEVEVVTEPEPEPEPEPTFEAEGFSTADDTEPEAAADEAVVDASRGFRAPGEEVPVTE